MGASFPLGWYSHSWPHLARSCHGGRFEHEPPARPRDSPGRSHSPPPSSVAAYLSWIPLKVMDRPASHPQPSRPPSRLPAVAADLPTSSSLLLSTLSRPLAAIIWR